MKQLPIWTLQSSVNRSGPDGLLQLQAQHGDHLYVSMPLIGRVNFMFHPDHAHTILVTHNKKFIKPRLLQRTLKSSFGNGLFTAEGDYWKRQRALMQPTFHHARIKGFAGRILGHIQHMADHDWSDGAVREINTDMHHLTLRVVLDSLFSADASSEEDSIAKAMTLLGQGLTAQASNVILSVMPDWFPLPPLRRKRQGSLALQQAVQHLIDERRALGEDNSPHDLLSALVFSRDAETDATMSDAQVRDELVTLYIAGHETTALLMAWTWVLLSRNPDAERALHAELDTVLGGRMVTLDDLPNLSIVRGVIQEALRLYPPAWFLMREAIEPVEIGDISLKAGELVMLVPYVNGRDGRFFDQPMVFLPSRWTPEFERSLPKGAFIPFGTGSRVCIGNGFAMMEAQLILAGLGQNYRVELNAQPQMSKSAPTLGFTAPVRGVIRAREIL
jgi:cytochrome P450